jgi:Rhodopirellula transposase DDE domain
MEVTQEVLAAKFEAVFPHLDERQRRLLMGAEARALGHGGIRVVARAAGVREATVSLGAGELEAGAEPLGRARRPGGGRKKAAERDPGLVPALLALVEPEERGDPVSPLRWTAKSTRTLAAELTRQGHQVSADTVGDLLREEGFSLQGNAKTIEGRRHPDRDAQFRYINDQARGHQGSGDPVISVDSKKKEQVGSYAGAGREYRPKGRPVAVHDHDFPDPAGLGKVVPYGVYDLAANTGWVNVGTDGDTAEFAVESIRRWWNAAGAVAYPAARRLLITADAGGSNGYRTRAWKAGLAALAAQTGLEITCCHFPPGTSKWNKIEHRLFSHITMNWRGRPLTSHEVIVNTIAATTTATGLRVHAELDTGLYPAGAKISDQQMAVLPLDRHTWHSDWNYTLRPRPAAAPAPPPAPPPPRRAGAGQDTLTCPALTGLPRQDLNALATALALPFAAATEARLYQQRGGPRRRPPTTGSRRPALDLTSQLAITLLHQHLAPPRHVLAWFTGTQPEAITRAITTITPLLARHPPPATPAPGHSLRTPADLIAYATAAGITLPPELKPAS